MFMKSSICIETIFTEYPFYERFDRAKNAGFDFVEFWSWDDKDIDRIKAVCSELELGVASFSGDKDFSLVDKTHNEKYLSFLEQSIKTAKYLNCENLVIHSNALGEGGIVVCDYSDMDKKELLSNMGEVLCRAKELAEVSGVNLVLEALNTKIDHVGNVLCTTADSISAIKKAPSPNVKILYDVYHMQIMEGNIINTLADNISGIGYIHIADVPGRHEPGTGELNYGNIFKMLKSLEYSGYIGFELFPKYDSERAVAAIKRLILSD